MRYDQLQRERKRAKKTGRKFGRGFLFKGAVQRGERFNIPFTIQYNYGLNALYMALGHVSGGELLKSVKRRERAAVSILASK